MARQADVEGWKADVHAYLRTRTGGSDPERDRLVAALLDGGYDRPEPWWQFLQHEEHGMGSSTATLDRLGPGKGVSLLQLYHWASRLIPKNAYADDAAYLCIWLAYARQQWCERQQNKMGGRGGGLATLQHTQRTRFSNLHLVASEGKAVGCGRSRIAVLSQPHTHQVQAGRRGAGDLPHAEEQLHRPPERTAIRRMGVDGVRSRCVVDGQGAAQLAAPLPWTWHAARTHADTHN